MHAEGRHGTCGDGPRRRDLSAVRAWLTLFTAACLGHSPLAAHPVPQKRHDRVVAVTLTGSGAVIRYRLEVDPWTVVYEDVPAVLEEPEVARLKTPDQWYQTFVREYAPILADGLTVTLDGRSLPVRTLSTRYDVLDSVRCEFIFEAPWSAEEFTDAGHRFSLYDGTYELEDDSLTLSLDHESPLRVQSKTEPPLRLQTGSGLDRRPGDERTRRTVSAVFSAAPPAPSVPPTARPTPVVGVPPSPGTTVVPVLVAGALAAVLVVRGRVRRSDRRSSPSLPGT